MPNNPMSEVEDFVRSKKNHRARVFPVEARTNVKRHYETLTRLVDNLRNLGIDQKEIDRHVWSSPGFVDSYGLTDSSRPLALLS